MYIIMLAYKFTIFPSYYHTTLSALFTLAFITPELNFTPFLPGPNLMPYYASDEKITARLRIYAFEDGNCLETIRNNPQL